MLCFVRLHSPTSYRRVDKEFYTGSLLKHFSNYGEQLLELVVITVVKSDVSGFLRTLRSVKGQSVNVKWRVVNPKEDIEIREILNHLMIEGVIERLLDDEGAGVYQAMNKAVLEAEPSEWLWFLNAGDEFAADDTYKKVLSKISEGDSRWLFGGHILMAENGDFLGSRNSPLSVIPQKQLFASDYVSHQGVVMEAGFINELGNFNTGLKIAADWELIVKACLVDSGNRIEQPIAVFHMGGLSTRGRQISNAELLQLRSEYLSSRYFIKSYSWYLYRGIRNLIVMKLENSFPEGLNLVRKFRLKNKK